MGSDHSSDRNSQVGKGGLPPLVHNTQSPIVNALLAGLGWRLERRASAGVTRPSTCKFLYVELPADRF